VLPLLHFWIHRTRNLLQNMTTNERQNRGRYAHFKSVDGGFVNPFDRGALCNCATYFCGSRGAESDGEELLLEGA